MTKNITACLFMTALFTVLGLLGAGWLIWVISIAVAGFFILAFVMGVTSKED